MKILVLCDQGNNRSVTIAHHLKYWNHDVIAAGVSTNSSGTLKLLEEWADRIIITEPGQYTGDKVQLWNVGPDVYPRPFNKVLFKKVRELMEEHSGEYKQ